MKKLFAFFLCIMIALFSVGCTFSTTVNLEMDAIQPWATSGNFEECVYSVSKKDAKGVVLGTGTLTTTATVDPSTNTTTVVCSFTFTQSGVSATDIINSSATILNSSCATISSSKDVRMASKPSLSYAFSANYENRKVDYFMDGSSTPTKSYEVPSSEKVVLDNEALYYIVRAFNPEEKNEGNFLLTNLYDCYLNDRISSYSVYYRASSALVSKDEFKNDTAQTSWNVISTHGRVNDDKIECYHARINRNTSNMSGAPVEMWFTKSAFSGKQRVMIKMRTTTRTIPDASVDYTMEYELTSFRIG